MNDLDKRIGKMGNLTEPDHSKLLQQLQGHLDNIISAIETTHARVRLIRDLLGKQGFL